jgi:hypothetical protein
MSPADVAAHVAAQGPVRTTKPAHPQRTILHRVPAGNPRGSWPAEEFAQQQRREGRSVDVVMDLATDSFLVIEVV